MRVVGFLLMVAVGLILDPLLMMWTVSTVHDWWPLVPLMSFGQAFAITFVTLVSLCAAVLAYLLASKLLD